MYSDSHIHSFFSSDSNADLEKIIEKALTLKMEHICITDHQDFDYPHADMKFELDLTEYYSTLSSLKSKYRDKLELLIGVEIGLVPFISDKFTSFLNQVPFDFIIGSSHLVHNKDPYYPEFFENRSDKECFEEYFLSIIENLKIHENFDVYGHIDYIVRYSPNKNAHYSYAAFADYIDEILKSLIHMGKGIEINTAGYKYGLDTTNPCREIIKRYRELGGEIITIGSDAHTPEYLGHCFDKAANILTSCGFTHYNIFRQRKPVFLKLNAASF